MKKATMLFPFYLGARWGSINPPSAAVRAHQEYLTNLASFISGTFLPPGILPFIYQYRVVAGARAGPAAGDLTAAPRQIDNGAIQSIIAAAQGASGNGHLPAYGPNVLIMLFPDGGFTPCDTCSNWSSTAYHRDAGANSFYNVLFGDDTATCASQVSQAVSHEIFEATTDPILGSAWEDLTISPPKEICDSEVPPVWGAVESIYGNVSTTLSADSKLPQAMTHHWHSIRSRSLCRRRVSSADSSSDNLERSTSAQGFVGSPLGVQGLSRRSTEPEQERFAVDQLSKGGSPLQNVGGENNVLAGSTGRRMFCPGSPYGL